MTFFSPPSYPPTLTGRMARGVKWAGAAQTVDYIVTIVSLSILAHLLSAADFGAQAAAAAVVGIPIMIGDLGFGNALIQSPSLVRGNVRWASLICTGSGLSLGFLLLSLSSRIGLFFQVGEQVGDLLDILWLCVLFHPPGAIPRALMTRRMDFKRLAVIDAASALMSGVTAVFLAMTGEGARSLAWGYVVRVASSSAISWICFPSIPAQEGERTTVRALMKFGLRSNGAGILNYLSANIDYFLIGRYLGQTSLGVYYLAYQLVSLAYFRFVSILLKVLFPALSSIQDDLDRLKRGYLRAIRGIALFAFPILTILGALADPIVAVFYGADKQAASLLVQILCIMGICKSVGGAVGPIFLARGRADFALFWNLFALITTGSAVMIGISYGTVGVALGIGLNSLLLLTISEGLVHRLIPLDFQTYLKALIPRLFSAIGAGLATSFGIVFAVPHLSSTATLISGAIFGGIPYMLLIRVLDRKAFSEAREFLYLLGLTQTSRNGNST